MPLAMQVVLYRYQIPTRPLQVCMPCIPVQEPCSDLGIEKTLVDQLLFQLSSTVLHSDHGRVTFDAIIDGVALA